jgi:hypothetical protein
MISVLAVREQKSIQKISNEIGRYLSEVQKVKDWCMIGAVAIMKSDYPDNTKRIKLKENKLRQAEMIKAIL